MGISLNAGNCLSSKDALRARCDKYLFAEDLGYEYIYADSKEIYLANQAQFLDPALTERPIIFEIFTNHADESDALQMIRNLIG